MAVAAHVSRVAKDYTPYGYSIMESVLVTITSAGTGTAESDNVLAFMVDDADVYIEKVEIVGVDALAKHAANFITVSVASFDNLAAAEGDHASFTTEDVAGGVALVEDGLYDATVSTPVVPSGRIVVVGCVKNVTTQANDIEVWVGIRYRRKA